MLDFVYEETIDAPAELVFGVIENLPAYVDWNPFITADSGSAGLHQVVKGKSFLGPFTVSYRHKIYEFTPGRSLCWKDFGLVALFACGDRARYVESTNGKTRYKCHLKVSGPLSFIAKMLFGKHLKHGIVEECKALKALAEKTAGETSR